MPFDHVLERLIFHAHNTPEKPAIHILNATDITVIEDSITYHELIQRVMNVARWIGSKTAIGSRVLLCYPTSIDVTVSFYACLWAKVIPIFVGMPTQTSSITKFLSIEQDCGASLTLTDDSTFKRIIEENLFTPRSHVMCIPTQLAPTHMSLPKINAEDIAYLQYTSGSTSDPKGVMISHGNLRDNISTMSQAFAARNNSIGVSWLPHTHDMGLVGSFLHSVDMGATIYFMSPSAFIRKPFNWLLALSTYRATMTGCPCFGLQLCMDHSQAEKIAELDLSALEHIIIGSEMIDANVLAAFEKTLAPAKLSTQALAPSYGLAEATVFVSSRSGYHVDGRANKKIVSCGKPYLTLKIVSPESHQICEEGETGEIWLAGPSISPGYWEKPAYQHNFNQQLNNDERHSFFRTGDLAYLHQGELYPVGRIKDTIIIHGVNHCLQDIENTITSCIDKLRHATCVAICWRPDGVATDHLVILLRLKKRITLEEETSLIIKIRTQVLKEHQLVPEDIRVVTFNFPRTSSGKIQRHECVSRYEELLTSLTTEQA